MAQPTKTIKSDDPGARLYNFSAGPATLPLPVIEEIRQELPVYRDIGASILEIGHRTPAYAAIVESAVSRLRSLLTVGEDWHVLFLQGGASMQFYQVPLNFLPAKGSADYLLTGNWAKKAFKEANFVGSARSMASSADKNFSCLPSRESWDINPAAAYTYFTSNNTLFGTQFKTEPDVASPLVCDASSDFLSKSLNMRKYGLIFAGAQKNLGPAGVTVVLIHDDFLQQKNTGLPTMLDYGTHVSSLFNTPPVYAVYVVEKVLRWLDGIGGIEAVAKDNRRKADLLYDRIDSSDFYRGTASKEDRSDMNVCFRLADEAREHTFLAEAADAGLIALKGHRAVGGIRASIYNACPVAAAQALTDFMEDFERRNG